jgi:hypothetical protein
LWCLAPRERKDVSGFVDLVVRWSEVTVEKRAWIVIGKTLQGSKAAILWSFDVDGLSAAGSLIVTSKVTYESHFLGFRSSLSFIAAIDGLPVIVMRKRSPTPAGKAMPSFFW